MRPWARWLLTHRMRWLVLLAVVLVQFPLAMAIHAWRALCEATDDTRRTWRDVKTYR